MFSSCARFSNQIDSDGALIGTTKGDWIVIKQSGGVITDVWKLEEQFVQSEQGSDGWLFVDQNGNPVHVGGDMKAIRVNKNKEEIFSNYMEYHMEHDSLSYMQRYRRSTTGK
ncbi:hypothetical protein IT400_02360 [Candidatus Nomurabacteria bacterium]|nr:hypothetical protein [Candidatus Nomurabacteria bacterium]